jgi:pimeloyl-ACP methyl ester carboxylesterase
MRSRAVTNRTSVFAVVAIYSGLTCWNVNDQRAAAEPTSQADLVVMEKDATVFSFKLHYREAGEGPAVILLHGLGGDGSRWISTMAALASEFRVIAPDQIGFGQSDKPLVNYSHAMLEEFLVEFMKAIEVPKASLLGHSMGAYVSIYAAVHHPQMVDRLILVDGGGLEYKPRPPHIIQIQNGTTLAETREYFDLMFYDKKFITDQMVRENLIRRLHAGYTIDKMQEARAKGIGTVTSEQAARIIAPTLILWGKHDRLLDPSDAQALSRVIPGSRAVLIEEAGHIPQVEKPELFNQLVRDFLTAD